MTEPPTLDSRKATDSTSGNVLHMLFDGLTRIGHDECPHPAVAKKISISEDGKKYTFFLRKTYWSNGDRVTAGDFLYAWQKILDPAFPSIFADKLYVIKNAAAIKEGKLPADSLGVKAIDDYTLEVELKFPAPYFLELTAFPTFFPVNKKIDQKNSEWASEAGPDFVSNGPFMLKQWDHESQMLLLKNPHYWDADAVKLDSLHIAMIDDGTTELYMFEMNELDWAGFPFSSLPPDVLPKLIEEKSAQHYDATATYFYKLNTDKFPFNNINIRRAFAYAMNRKDIVEHVTQAGQLPALSLVPPMVGWPTPYNFFNDNDEANAKFYFQKGLDELGISKEDFPTIILSYNTNREHQKIAQAIQQQWLKNLDIFVQLEHCDWKVYLSKINKQDYQIARMGWLGDYKDPISFLNPYKYRDDPEHGGHNETGWESPDYIALLDKADHEIDPVKRSEILKQAEGLLISEMPLIPIYFVNGWYMKKPYVKNVFISSLGIADFKRAYIETGS